MKKQLVNIALADVELSLDDSHEWRVKGYATRFGNVNCYGFKILAGAYQDVIASGAKPKMFFNHDSFAVPIGYWDKLEENAVGLKVEGVLTQGVSMAKDVTRLFMPVRLTACRCRSAFLRRTVTLTTRALCLCQRFSNSTKFRLSQRLLIRRRE